MVPWWVGTLGWGYADVSDHGKTVIKADFAHPTNETNDPMFVSLLISSNWPRSMSKTTPHPLHTLHSSPFRPLLSLLWLLLRLF